MNGAVLGNADVWPITFLASILIWIMFGGLLMLWIVDGRIKKEQALHAFFSAILAWTVANMIKSLFPTIRPFELNGEPVWTISTYHSSGAFPSAHAATAFALAFTVWLHERKLGLFFILAALGVGVGRILGNVHFLIDIIGGAVIGSFIAFIVEKLHVYQLINGDQFKK